MVRILAIGNSFSQDATTYLHDLAAAGGFETKVVNLYIGGCPLKTHWENAENDRADYEYQLNGVPTGKNISIGQALREENWDFVTLQQASGDSGLAHTYEPYLGRLSAYVSGRCAGAEQLIHETWAYETGSTHPAFGLYGSSPESMHQALRGAYKSAAERIGAAVIPCGEVIAALRARAEFDVTRGGQPLSRDGFHLQYVYGRYAAAAVWYETLLRGDVTQNTFRPLDGGDEVLFRLIAQTVRDICTHFQGL